VKRGKETLYFYDDAAKEKALGKDFDESQMIEIESGEVQNEELENDKERLLDAAGEESLSTPAGATSLPRSKASEGDLVQPKGRDKISIQRYKGLGEMNSEELWETTMDPAKRILKQVNIEDAQEADKVFDMLMGDDVPARKSFIQSNAKLATLDI
jgi:DNA gyrase/topoisomerase IV subunit B